MTTTMAGLLNTPAADRLPDLTLSTLISVVEDAGLVGRGGAGFPTAIKLRAVAGAARLTVVANAMEGEPLSTKDAVLLQHAPHLVIEGLHVVAHALGARRRILAVGTHMPTDRVSAVAARYGVEVATVTGGFVAGQASALARGLSGLPAVPADPSVRVSTRGINGRPTLILNAETLAHVALAARCGPTAVTTSLFTLSGAVALPGVIEAPLGSVLRDIVDRGRPASVQAVLLGGYHGTWLPSAALGVRLQREDLAPWGATVGAGVVHVLPDGACPLRTTADIATYLAGESAGQCGPCINALPRVADTIRRLARGPADPHLPAQVARLSALATGRGACAHPDGTVRMVTSAMRVFADDVSAHLEGRCQA